MFINMEFLSHIWIMFYYTDLFLMFQEYIITM